MSRRACMLVHEYFPRDFRVRREARALAAAGWQIEIVCLKKPGEPARELVDGLPVTRLPVRRHRGSPLPVYMTEYLAFAAAAGGLLLARRLEAAYDVVHVHAPPDFLALAGLPAGLGGARLILDIHDLTPELYGSRFGKKGGQAARMVMQVVERGSCALADRVITVTDAFAGLLAGRGVAGEKITVLHNSPDPEAFDPGLRDERRAEGFEIVHHGTLVQRYGVDLLVEAFARVAEQLPAASLNIYGEGDWLPRLKERAQARGLDGRVVLHGEVAQEVVARALARADLCVVPNRRDGFTDLLLPTKLLEALHMGVATIASATRVIAETFRGGGVHLVQPGDVEALAGAILQLATNADQRKRLAKEGRAQAARFDWNTEKQKLVSLYESLL